MKGEIIMADIKRIKLPNGNIYNLKDSAARTSITNITEGTTKLPYGKSLSITNNVELNLLDPDNNVLSTVNLPRSGGAVQISKNSDGTWVKSGTSDSVYDMDLGTIVRYAGDGKGLTDFGKVKLIAASSDYPYNYSLTTFYTSIKAGGFVGVIVDKIGNDQTTVIKRIDEDGTIFPGYTDTGGSWMQNYTTLDALEKWFANKYSIISKSAISSSDLGVTSLDGTTTYTVLEARLLRLPRDMVALMIQLNEGPNEALKLSKRIITLHNWSVIGWCGSPHASAGLPEVNSDRTIQMSSSWRPSLDIGILYGHTI